MDDVTVAHAKEHLADLIERASRGEDVRISDPTLGTVRLQPVEMEGANSSKRAERRPGRLKGKITVPARLMEQTSEEELNDWYRG